MSEPARGPTKAELDAIGSSLRMSSYYRQMRHSRKCRRCGAYLAVDQPDPWLCRPCQIAQANNGADRERATGPLRALPQVSGGPGNGPGVEGGAFPLCRLQVIHERPRRLDSLRRGAWPGLPQRAHDARRGHEALRQLSGGV